MVLLNHESHWVLANIHDALEQLHFCMSRGLLHSHHMLLIFCYSLIQRNKELEGGPPCDSMPVDACGAYYGNVRISFSVA